MRVLAIGLLGAVLFLSSPSPTLAHVQSKHPHHAAKAHHWFWQHWHIHHRKPQRK